jgi:outer membrane lipoprotein carrier protein
MNNTKSTRRLVCFALVLVCLFAFSMPAGAGDLESLLAGVKAKYGKLTDFKADFKQETMVKTLGRKQSKSGTVMFKRPDKMRWDFQAPAKEQLITDGYTLWMYQPEEKVVYMSKLDQVNNAKVPMQILSGDIDVKKQFNVKLLAPANDDARIELKPKQDAAYEKAILSVNSKTFEIKKIDIYDLYGNVTELSLTNVKFNTKINESKFVFTPIPGVRVEAAPVME